ncbi:MAG: LamG-like jellyroll fold domain-containing protein [Pseudomonadota bacterium]
MNAYSPFFDASNAETLLGMSTALDISEIDDVPSQGTGLAGAAYAPGDKIWSIGMLDDIIATNLPDATFTASNLAYGGNKSETTLSEFLKDDAASISGDGNVEMGPSGLVMKGFIFIPEGAHEIAISSDDGFELEIGGVLFSEFTGTRGTDETARVVNFEGGLYEVELKYFDAGGGQSLTFEIDGLPIDQSALYGSVAEFQNPGSDVPLIPVEDYHPSLVNPLTEDGDNDTSSTAARDIIEGDGGDDTIDGGNGDDEIYGGYGDDSLKGGDGDDVIDGGRGSDLLHGGAGDDLIISRSDAGEQRIGQLAVGNPTRDDPDNEVNNARQKLKGYEDQALIADDVLIGGEGRDTFLISPQINAKLDIIQKHVRSDGTINWAGVAGENDELHDHWVDSFGIDVIADYNAEEDQIVVAGHTATVCDVEYRDIDGDGDMETIVSISSDQSGGCVTGAAKCSCIDDQARSGGAHDQDLLGQIIVYGDMVTADDIVTDAGVTYGIVDTYAEVVEALLPAGETKVTKIDGKKVFGYDTRDEDGNYGAITGSPEDFIDNDYIGDVEFADPTDPGPELTRGPFDQLGTETVAGETKKGTGGADVIAPDGPAATYGVPGALGFWSLGGGSVGAYENGRDGPGAKAYTLYENQALLRTDGMVYGPGGVPNGALSFNGEDEFAYIAHDPAFNVTQGTIAIWAKPFDLSSTGMIVAKDAQGNGDGGHFRLGHVEGGKLFLRMADGDRRGGNNAWETDSKVLDQGSWNHIAVSFTENGVKVYVDGKAISDAKWTAVDGDVATPGKFTEAYLVQNDEPWILGADSHRTEISDTAAEFAADDDKLDNAFEGALADFGVWGGYAPSDALSGNKIRKLIEDGPGSALTNEAGVQPMEAGDDNFSGKGGADTISGEAGDDTLSGNGGNDEIYGGYGDDILRGDFGDDTLDGGRGSDLLIGGEGDDVLYAWSDAGEQRAGQLVIGEPSRDFPDASISDEYLKLVDWVDQPLVADDILVGGDGADTFYFGTLINAKQDIILRHVNEDRTINWAGVAGENDRIHDHWVDSLGIDIVADYNASEDVIKVIGHTTRVSVDYRLSDSDGDGIKDNAVSIITAYSQQGDNGGAHDEDLLGFIVVHGDLVDEDDIVISPKPTPGIVDTIDELQEALAPTGETKTSTRPNGDELFGYDSRDVAGDPLATNPEYYSANPYRDLVDFDDTGGRGGAFEVVVENEGDQFDGLSALEIAHTNAQALEEGTWAFSFTADAPGGRDQTLLSKDHSGFKDGGHLTVWIDGGGRLKVRIQDKDDSYYLHYREEPIVAGEEYQVAFSFDQNSLKLFINGELVDEEDGFVGGMLGNTEDTIIGASSSQRRDDDDRVHSFFEGEITNIVALDRALTPLEGLLLAEAGTDPTALEYDYATDGRERGDLSKLEAVWGSAGKDTMVGTNDDDYLLGSYGKDKLKGMAGNDVLDGGVGKDKLKGGGGNDDLHGGKGKDKLIGGGDDDMIFGGKGKDVLKGGAGNDTLDGGGGKDILVGGTGADQFTFGLKSALDIVRDFKDGEDKIAITAPYVAFEDLAINRQGNDTHIKYDGGKILLKGVNVNEITEDDFIF